MSRLLTAQYDADDKIMMTVVRILNSRTQDTGQGDDLGNVGALDPSLSNEEEPPAEDNLQTGDIEDVV